MPFRFSIDLRQKVLVCCVIWIDKIKGHMIWSNDEEANISQIFIDKANGSIK